MSEALARTFIDALHTLEDSKDAAPLAALYTDDAKIGNLLAPDHFTGPEGAQKFWTEYRGTFDTARSTFRTVIIGDGAAALEWTTQGTGFEGSAIQYSGMTLLEMSGGKITRSTAYFDPKALGDQIKPSQP